MQNQINLAGLKRGQRATIDYQEGNELPAKFYELGFIPGARVEIKYKAPFRGPVCVYMIENNTLVALRESEARCITAALL